MWWDRPVPYGRKAQIAVRSVRSVGARQWTRVLRRARPDGGMRKAALLRAGRSEALLSGASRFAILGVSSAFSILTARLIIESAGPEVYGFVALVLSVALMLNFADFGIGAAVTNAVSAFQARTSQVDPGDVILAAVRASALGGAVLAGACLITYSLGWWEALLGSVESQPQSLGSAALVSVVLMVLAAPLGVSQRILLGAGRNHVAVLCQGVAAPVTFMSAALMLSLDVPIGWVASIYAIGQVTSLLCTDVATGYVTGYSVMRSFRLLLQRNRRRTVSIASTAVPMVVITLMLPLALQSHRLMLSHFDTPRGIAVYSVAAQMYNPLWAVISAGTVTLWPKFSHARVKGQEAVRALWTTALIAVTLVAALSAVALMWLGPWGVTLIAAGHLEVPTSLLAVFGLLLLVQAAHTPSAMMLTDDAGLRLQATTTVFMLGITVGLGAIFARVWGPSGPVLASVIAVFFCQAVPCWIAARSRVMNRQH